MKENKTYFIRKEYKVEKKGNVIEENKTNEKAGMYVIFDSCRCPIGLAEDETLANELMPYLNCDYCSEEPVRVYTKEDLERMKESSYFEYRYRFRGLDGDVSRYSICHSFIDNDFKPLSQCTDTVKILTATEACVTLYRKNFIGKDDLLKVARSLRNEELKKQYRLDE